MPVLPTELRNKLELTIVEARDIAEAGAKAALEALAVHHHKLYGHMSPKERRLRNHLRARARQLGDKQNRKSELELHHLIRECAYEHWHRMLFARFLAENDLLVEPEMGVAISLEECEELAKEEGKDLWTLASEFAQHMLPQIFRPDAPILKVTFAREHRIKLEKLLDDLEPGVFTASDSLGWVYQFWQSKRKKEVNEVGDKIGADELPAVTQLFTEPYMVSFLLDNTLGSWWAARRLTQKDLKTITSEQSLRKKVCLPSVPLKYLRFVRDENGMWVPAAGTFDAWPEDLCELKILDPCCGSGHFLTTAFLMLVPMRMELEGISARNAVDAVLRENLHGLEIDQRCVELAAFALALAAWRYPDAGGYRQLPDLHLACTGLSISAGKDEWLALSGDNKNLRIALNEIFEQYKHAPVVGSLINPGVGLFKDTLMEIKWEDVAPLLESILPGKQDEEKIEIGVVARGLSKANALLMDRYHLSITNVPYLSAGKQSQIMFDYCKSAFPDSCNDLATVFLERINSFMRPGGVSGTVLPQNWLFLATYRAFREKLLKNFKWNFIARLGAKSFSTPMWDYNVQLLIQENSVADSNHKIWSINLSDLNSPQEKASRAPYFETESVPQDEVLKAKYSIVSFGGSASQSFFGDYITTGKGICTGDSLRFVHKFWEHPETNNGWVLFRTSVNKTIEFSGCENLLLWEMGKGQFIRFVKERLGGNVGAWIRGKDVWGRKGISVSRVSGLAATFYFGEFFDDNAAVLVPNKEDQLAAIWCYAESGEFEKDVRKLNQKLSVDNTYLKLIGFDINRWSLVAESKFPGGLPQPYSDDPTQWIFHGHPVKSDYPLQVALARLLGYRWPAELDAEMELSNEQREWVSKCDALLEYVDEDGIVCISSMRGEEPAADRLREILSVAFGHDWSPAREQELIKATGANTAAFDDWLRDHFFEQHCKLFHHRPFIWHIWDGRRRDGFHALVNYHKLSAGNGKGRQLLENLTYSYLGDWITRQKEGVRQGEGGAEDRLAAALELQKRLIAIIEGEPPFDIFVRWKPIEEQLIGWEPDINDGVRINIRPFMADDIPGGRKGAGILRWKPNIKWNKDRGKEPSRPREQYPWFWKDGEFTGDRVNDIHLTNEEKR